MPLSYDPADISGGPVTWEPIPYTPPHADIISPKYAKIRSALVGSSGHSLSIIKKDTVTINSENYEALRCNFVISGTGELYRVELKATAVLRNVNSRTKVELVAGTDNILNLPAEFIYNATDAQKYASQEARRIKYGDFSYSWSSKDDVAIGSFVNLQVSNPYINTQVQILKKTKQRHEPFYHYEGIGTAEFNLETVIRKGDTYFTPSQLAFFTDSSVRDNVVTIAASDYYYPANRRCDGTADQVEINAAITKLSSESGGGVVKLSPGTFYLSAAIELDDNIVLEGAGAKTILERSSSDYAIEGIGTSGTHKENIVLRSFEITRDSSDSGGEYIYITYVDHIDIEKLLLINQSEDTIIVDNCTDVVVQNNILRDGSPGGASECSGIRINDSDGIVVNNVIKNMTALIYNAIYIDTCDTILVSGNSISEITCTAGDFYGIYYYLTQRAIIGDNLIKNCVSNTANSYGIYQFDNRATIGNNSIENIYAYSDLSSYTNTAIYIRSGATNTRIINNSCKDNGNLIDRGNCESTTAPMVQGETTPDSSGTGTYQRTADPYEGTYCWELVSAGTFDWRRYTDDGATTNLHGFVPGLTYKLTWYGKKHSNLTTTEGFVEVIVYDSGWSSLSKVYITSDTYNNYESTFTLPASATGCNFYCAIGNSATAGEYIRIDNIRLQPIGINNEYDQQFVDSGTDTQVNINSWQ